MAANLYHRLLRIAFYSDLHATRLTLALAEFIWALTLLWPGETFDRPTYIGMKHVMSEEAWGLVFLISSALQVSILFRGEYHDKFACYFAAWNAALWGFVTVSMYMSVFPPPAAISGEAALSFAAGWVWIRSGYITAGKRSNDYGAGG